MAESPVAEPLVEPRRCCLGCLRDRLGRQSQRTRRRTPSIVIAFGMGSTGGTNATGTACMSGCTTGSAAALCVAGAVHEEAFWRRNEADRQWSKLIHDFRIGLHDKVK